MFGDFMSWDQVLVHEQSTHLDQGHTCIDFDTSHAAFAAHLL